MAAQRLAVVLPAEGSGESGGQRRWGHDMAQIGSAHQGGEGAADHEWWTMGVRAMVEARGNDSGNHTWLGVEAGGEEEEEARLI